MAESGERNRHVARIASLKEKIREIDAHVLDLTERHQRLTESVRYDLLVGSLPGLRHNSRSGEHRLNCERTLAQAESFVEEVKQTAQADKQRAQAEIEKLQSLLNSLDKRSSER